MPSLTTEECTHLMGLWRIGDNCNLTSSLEQREDSLLEYVKGTFGNDDIRDAYRKYMKVHLSVPLSELQYNTSNLTVEECNLFINAWSICCCCGGCIPKDESPYGGTSIAESLGCGCIWHAECYRMKVKPARDYHTVTCTIEYKRSAVTRYVKQKFRGVNPRVAYYNYMRQHLPNLTVKGEDYKRKWKAAQQLCEKLEKQNTEMRTEIVNLKNENQKKEEQKEQFANEKANLVSKFNDMKDERDRITGKLAKLTNEIREMKKKYQEVQGDNSTDIKEKIVDDDVEESDESIFDYEYDSFKLQFMELQKTAFDLTHKCFSTRNSKLIGEITRKIVPTTEISSNVKEEVVAVLKKGYSELKKALDDLTPLEAQFPTSSTNKKNTDSKLLD